MSNEHIKSELLDKLKREHRFWSFDQSSIKEVPDEILIEMTLT